MTDLASSLGLPSQLLLESPTGQPNMETIWQGSLGNVIFDALEKGQGVWRMALREKIVDDWHEECNFLVKRKEDEQIEKLL